MKYFSSLLLAMLIVTTPALMAYPHNYITACAAPTLTQIPNIQNFSYDDVMNLIAFIESDTFEERCSIEQLEQINRFISFLALEGARDDEKVDIGIATASLYQSNFYHYALATSSFCQFSSKSAIFNNQLPNILHCKSWFKKIWEQTKEFVKEHKKAIIIGTIVAVGVAVVVIAAVAISASAAGAAVAGIAGSAGAIEAGLDPHSKVHNHLETSKQESLERSLQEQISNFKETIAQEQMSAISSSEMSMEENGRIIGSLFTHQTIDNLANQAHQNPYMNYELQILNHNSQYPDSKWDHPYPSSPHFSADIAFSTDYSSQFENSNYDLNTLSYQARGDWALSRGHFLQAAQDFGRAIDNEPLNPTSYLGRGVANFELGLYTESITDYNTYISQKNESFSVNDFSLGFAKGLPRGIYDSGEGLLQFIADLSCHPFQTGQKVFESFSALSTLVKSGDWESIGELMSPELHQLLTEWDTLTSAEKGELSGYAFGKHGADILLPIGSAKILAKSSAVVRHLGLVSKNLHIAERTLVLEAIAEGNGAGINVREVVISANRTFLAGEELGLTAKDIGALKQSGELEQVIAKGRDFFAGKPHLQSSYDEFQNAEKFLQNFKEYMPESQAHSLISQAGINTFLKPVGIPENFRVKLTNEGAGIKYVHPDNEQTYIRVMPGKPHSQNPAQQKPYITWMKNGKTLDINGNQVSKKSLEAHIPFEDFKYVQ